jgi:hypothetical protein
VGEDYHDQASPCKLFEVDVSDELKIVRYDKNGFPVYEKSSERNKIKKLVPCPTPNDHDWGPPVAGEIIQDWYMGFDDQEFTQTCRKCNEKLIWVKSYDHYSR